MSAFNQISFILKNVLKILIILVFLLSLFYFYRSSNLLDIDKYSMKKGTFNLNNQKIVLSFKKFSDRRHKVCLNFFPKNQKEQLGLGDSVQRKNNFSININLLSVNNRIIKSNSINNFYSLSGEGINSWILLSFIPYKNEKKYLLEIEFKSNDHLFNKINKEILIQEDYDTAARPFMVLIKNVSLITLIITSFILLLFIINFIIKRKEKT